MPIEFPCCFPSSFLVSAALVLHLDVPFELRAQRSVELYGSFGAEASKGLGTSKGSYSEVSKNDGSLCQYCLYRKTKSNSVDITETADLIKFSFASITQQLYRAQIVHVCVFKGRILQEVKV